ncbi:hypothetical protein J6590_003267 [Homalodisca vitripennis]|nr:hypothetical protein J6590_003267 [Homalodisca vitripennis]
MEICKPQILLGRYFTGESRGKCLSKEPLLMNAQGVYNNAPDTLSNIANGAF